MLEVIYNQTHPMATIVKPKDRQFQVVPVPAIFTRGRWECRDYKEAPNFVVTSSHNGGADAGQLAGPVGDYIDKPTTTPVTQGDVPSTIPLMRNDAKNVAAAQGGGAAAVAAILPDILPTAAGIDSGGDGSNFISQTAQDNDGKELGSSITGNSNQVAIDNKIEQAMDLVKTHLTFAVREEVEQLRTQISELESRVNGLEGENQILRQFAPPEIVANLPLLLQNSSQQQQSGQQHKSSLPPQQSTVAMSGFENTMASIPSVSSAPLLTTMAGPPASTALAGASVNPIAAVTHTISTTSSATAAAGVSPIGNVTLHVGGSTTPSPPPSVTPLAVSEHSFVDKQQQARQQAYQQQQSNFVVTSTPHDDVSDFQKY